MSREIPDKERTLAEYVYSQLTHNASYRQSMGIDDRLQRNRRMLKGEYDERDLQYYGEDSSYFNVVQIKVSEFETAFSDLNAHVMLKPWTLEPTPVPKLPYRTRRMIAEQVIADVGGDPENVTRERLELLLTQYKGVASKLFTQQAESGTKKMEQKIFDMLVEGGWEKAYADFISDLGTCPTAYLRAPMLKSERKLRWVGDEIHQAIEFVPKVERLDPVACYPSPDSIDAQDGTNFIHIDFMSTAELIEAKDLDSFNTAACEEIIKGIADNGDTKWWQWATTGVSGSAVTSQWNMDAFMTGMDYSNRIPVIKYYGGQLGAVLKEAGLTDKVSPHEYYEAEIWTVGEQVIRTVINRSIGAIRPIFATSFRKKSGSIHGECIADLLYHIQKDILALKRAHMENSEYSARPISEIDSSRFAADEIPDNIVPGDALYTKPSQVFNDGRAVQMYNVPSHAQELLSSFDYHIKLADQVSGIPSELTGRSSSASVNRTASVYSASVEGSLKRLKKVDSQISMDVTKPIVKAFFNLVMMFGKDESLKYDAQIIVRGSAGLIKRETDQGQNGLILQGVLQGVQQQLLPAELYTMIARQGLENQGVDTSGVLPDPQRERHLALLRGELNPQATGATASAAGVEGIPTPNAGAPINTAGDGRMVNTQTAQQAPGGF